MRPVLTIVFEGHIPTKKNHRRTLKRGNRTFSVPSEAHEDWNADQVSRLSYERRGHDLPLQPPYAITYEFTVGDLKQFDLSNAIESVNDLLICSNPARSIGVILDDSWQYLRMISPKIVGFSFGKPNCKVDIYSLASTSFDQALWILQDKPQFKATAKSRGVTQKVYEQFLQEEMRFYDCPVI